MALVKTGQIAIPKDEEPVATLASARRPEGRGVSRQRTHARSQKAAERIASATAEFASGMTEAASAAEELRKAMEMVSSSATQAAGASEESQRAFEIIDRQTTTSKTAADAIGLKITALQDLIGAVSEQIAQSIVAISTASERQSESVAQVAELERQAGDIGEIVNAVARIADQTNLLALNAAIEAARAGVHGKGFAVVADEVRNLAETSETSACDIQGLIGEIQQNVKVIAEGINSSATAANAEVERGRVITAQLEGMRGDMVGVRAGSEAIMTAAMQSSAAASEARKGAEAIAAAAEEQSSACQETMKTVEQQSLALSQSEQAAGELQDLSEDLKNSSDVGKSAEHVAAAAEELSATVEEINRASTQVLTAVEEISRASQSIASATEEASAAITQMETGAQISETRGREARDKTLSTQEALKENRTAVDSLIDGVSRSVYENGKSREQINALEQIARRIDKIVDSITTVSVQTNMLAVNGSIEAARAGEFGKGFMVVSTDIRNLARDSSENAERIKDLVKAIQDQISRVQRDLEEIANAAVAEMEKNKTTAQNLSRMSEDMATVLEGAEAVLSGVSETSLALSEAKRGVEQIATAATQSNQATTEAANATREQSKGVEELAASVEEIASLADELQSAA